MAYWGGRLESYQPEQREFARIWQNAEKIVFSRTMTEATTGKTSVQRDFDLEAVRKLKESEHDIAIGGAELAGSALERNLVDEYELFVHPIVVGGGKPAIRPGLRRNLELLESQRFDIGVVYVRYRISPL
jgi:dihydrofolate reductase